MRHHSRTPLDAEAACMQHAATTFGKRCNKELLLRIASKYRSVFIYMRCASARLGSRCIVTITVMHSKTPNETCTPKTDDAARGGSCAVLPAVVRMPHRTREFCSPLQPQVVSLLCMWLLPAAVYTAAQRQCARKLCLAPPAPPGMKSRRKSGG